MKKRFGVISCMDLKKWGYSEGIFLRHSEIFSKNGKANPNQEEEEDWVAFHACRGEVPLIEDIHKFHGFLISGSLSSVHDNDDWIKKLLEFLKKAVEFGRDTQHPKIVGICFGHQLLAKALGGEVGLNPDKEFVLQTEEITGMPESADVKSIKGLFDDGSLRAVQSHGECVTKLPEQAVALASSPSCQYEVVQYNENCIGLQFHPDMYPGEAEELILPSISNLYNWSPDHINKSADSFKLECDEKRVCDVIIKFINDIND